MSNFVLIDRAKNCGHLQKAIARIESIDFDSEVRAMKNQNQHIHQNKTQPQPKKEKLPQLQFLNLQQLDTISGGASRAAWG
ncbi:MAG: hypothetical protein AB4290_14285 [Spirulina sp.]